MPPELTQLQVCLVRNFVDSLVSGVIALLSEQPYSIYFASFKEVLMTLELEDNERGYHFLFLPHLRSECEIGSKVWYSE